MTEEQKQALIEWCNWRIAKGKNTRLADASYDAAVVALGALTVPVNLPAPIQQTETSKYGLEPHDGYGLYWGSVETLNECKKLLRQQGYQVEGE